MDGCPVYVTWAEDELVGAGFWATADDLFSVAPFADPEDFRDPTLGTIWRALLDCGEPSAPVVCELLLERGELDRVGGEVRIATLAFAPQAAARHSPAALEALACLVRRWADRRRILLTAEARVQDAFFTRPNPRRSEMWL